MSIENHIGATEVVATWKDVTIKSYQSLLQPVIEEQVVGINPEQISLTGSSEPTTNDPGEAVIFKLLEIVRYFSVLNQTVSVNAEVVQVLEELLPWYLATVSPAKKGTPMPERPVMKKKKVYASDVVFKHKRKGQKAEYYHRIDRGTVLPPNREAKTKEEQKAWDREKKKVFKKVRKRYKKKSKATWKVVFGMTHFNPEDPNIQMNLSKQLIVEAKYPKLSKSQVKKYLEPKANPGLKLIELAKELDVTFTIRAKGSHEKYPITQEQAYRLIVEKTPVNWEMLEAIRQSEDLTSDLRSVSEVPFFEPFSEDEPEQVSFGVFPLALTTTILSPQLNAA